MTSGSLTTSFLRRTQPQHVEPLLRLQVHAAQGVGLVGPQAQADQDGLPGDDDAAREQCPARGLLVPLALDRAAVEGVEEALLAQLGGPDAYERPVVGRHRSKA